MPHIIQTKCATCGGDFNYPCKVKRSIKKRQLCYACRDEAKAEYHRAYDAQPKQLERRRAYMRGVYAKKNA